MAQAGGHFGPARVRSTTPLGGDVRLVEIEPEGGAEPYPTGSHLDIAVVLDGLRDLRSYSLVGERPVEGAYRIAVKRLPDSRGGSEFVHTLTQGDAIEVSQPRSDFELQHGRPQYLLIAGGIGITPMVGMAQALSRAGADLRLLYAARTRDALVFADELEALLGDRLDTFVDADARMDLGAEIDGAGSRRRGCTSAGRRACATAAQHAWRERERPADRLRFETFATAGRFPTKPFLVRVRDHGDREVEVARNRTLLAALEDAGIDVMSDCLRGECGLCAVTVLDRDEALDHRDVFLSDEEQVPGGSLCACVSRAVGGSLTIDTGFRPASERMRATIEG